MELSTWLTFFAASWAISISPGPGAIASMSAGLNHGFKYGYVTIFGLILGIWTQLLVVGAGLGALMATSHNAFVVVKWLGVAYLVWLGIQQWRAPARPMVAASDSAVLVSQRTLIVKAWMINVVNPKGTVFLLAVVPQFINTALASRVLGALKKPSHIRAMNRTFGTLFVLAGSLLALFKRSA
jgi:homoserine/homoserine lactone efflux protein